MTGVLRVAIVCRRTQAIVPEIDRFNQETRNEIPTIFKMLDQIGSGMNSYNPDRSKYNLMLTHTLVIDDRT